MRKLLAKLVYEIWGWHIVGKMPDQKKYIIMVAPHTSNIDFFVGFFGRDILGFKCKFLAKKQLFKPPLGWFMKAIGGLPVDRSSSFNFVEQIAQHFEREDKLILAMTPEGKRKRADKWKTGFYYMAQAANVPILPIVFDYEKKEFRIEELFQLTNNAEADISKLMSIYYNVKGAIPENGVLPPA